MSRLTYHKITPKTGAAYPVTLDEAKDYIRVDFTSDDDILNRLIKSSTERLQEYSCRVFVNSDCEAIYKQECGGDAILLSFSDNIELASGSPYAGKLDGDSILNTEDTKVSLTYTAGYTEYPEWIKQALLIDIAWRYENLGDVAESVINTEVKEYLAPYVNWSLI